MAFGKSAEDTKKEAPMHSISSNPAPTLRADGSNPVAFLGQGTKVVGTLTFTGPVELDGYVEGELIVDKLTVGEAAVVKAKIRGAEIVVKGSVTGDIHATKRLLLKKPAKVVGNISSTNLSIEEGVVFEGQCSMTSSATGPGTATHTATAEKLAVSR